MSFFELNDVLVECVILRGRLKEKRMAGTDFPQTRVCVSGCVYGLSNLNTK